MLPTNESCLLLISQMTCSGFVNIIVCADHTSALIFQTTTVEVLSLLCHCKNFITNPPTCLLYKMCLAFKGLISSNHFLSKTCYKMAPSPPGLLYTLPSAVKAHKQLLWRQRKKIWCRAGKMFRRLIRSLRISLILRLDRLSCFSGTCS